MNILLYQILVLTLDGKINIRIINLKYQLQYGRKNLYYLMDHIPYPIFKIVVNIFLKSMRKNN